MKTGTAPALEKVNKKFYSDFLAYAKAKNIEITNDNLILWDEKVNHNELKNYLEARLGKALIYSIGLKEVFKRYLYNMEILKMKPNTPTNPPGFKVSGMRPMHSIKGGIHIPTASTEQMDVLIDKQKQMIESAVQKLKFYKLSVEQIHDWIDEFYED